MNFSYIMSTTSTAFHILLTWGHYWQNRHFLRFWVIKCILKCKKVTKPIFPYSRVKRWVCYANICVSSYDHVFWWVFVPPSISCAKHNQNSLIMLISILIMLISILISIISWTRYCSISIIALCIGKKNQFFYHCEIDISYFRFEI